MHRNLVHQLKSNSLIWSLHKTSPAHLILNSPLTPPRARRDGRPLGIVAVQIITCARAPLLASTCPERDRRTHGHSFSSSSTATTITTSSSATAAAATPHDAEASTACARPKMHAEALPFEGYDLSLALVEQAAYLRSTMGSPKGRIS